VHGLWGGHVFGDGGCNNVVGMSGLSFELDFTQLKLNQWCLYLQRRIHGTRRWCLLGVRCRQVQDGYRECRVHGLWGGHVFGDSGCNNVVGMLGLSFELEFTQLKYSD
jgi:hypothetical protein